LLLLLSLGGSITVCIYGKSVFLAELCSMMVACVGDRSSYRDRVGHRSSYRDGGVLGLSGHHSLTGGLGQLILHIITGNLGHGVTMLHLDGYFDDLRIVDTVLSGHLAASMFNCSGHRVSNSVSNRSYRGHMSDGSNWGSCVSTMVSYRGDGSNWGSCVGCGDVLRVSLSFSISFSFDMMVSSHRWCIAKGVHDLLAFFLIFNLLSGHTLCGADLLSFRSAHLGS